MSSLGSRPSCLHMLYLFPLFFLCVHPKSSLWGFLRRGTYIGLHSIIPLFPHLYLNVTGLSLSSLHIASAFVRCHSPSFSTFEFFSIRFRYPPGVSDIPTKSSANVNADTVYFPHCDFLFCCSNCYYHVINKYLENNYVIAYIPMQLLPECERFRSFSVQHHITSSTFHIKCHHSPHLSAEPNFAQLSHNPFLHTLLYA